MKIVGNFILYNFLYHVKQRMTHRTQDNHKKLKIIHHVNPAIDVYIIDRYTYYALNFLEKVEPSSTKTLGEFFKVCPRDYCLSTVGVRRDLFRRDPDKVPVTDFFGSLRPVELTLDILNILPASTNYTKNLKAEKRYDYVAQFLSVSQYT